MTSKEMLSVFLQNHSDNYDHLSSPLYYHEEGPYLIALDTKNNPCTLYLYEFLDPETFLANPQKVPPAFRDDDFIWPIIDDMDFDEKESKLQTAQILKLKVVPPTLACQMQVKKMYRTCPPQASRIFFMADSGKLTYSRSLLSMAVRSFSKH